MGCGRESIGRVLVGLETPVGGDIILGGNTFRPRHPAHARKCGVSYMPVDRKEKGLCATFDPGKSQSAKSSRLCGRRRRLESPKRGVVNGALASLAERSLPVGRNRITTLSGGNQQKVLFGRVSSGEPRVLLLEDPTSRIDAGAKADLHRLVRAMAEKGLGILLFSSGLRRPCSSAIASTRCIGVKSPTK